MGFENKSAMVAVKPFQELYPYLLEIVLSWILFLCSLAIQFAVHEYFLVLYLLFGIAIIELLLCISISRG